MFAAFIVTAPGLEAVTAAELATLGVPIEKAEPGGLTVQADAATLARLNLHLRTATRILVRAAEFHAFSFAELERHARKIPWGDFLPDGVRPVFRVTSKKSKLYHEDAVAERLLRAAGADPAATVVEGAPSQEFVVRVFRDQVTLSADSSGELLHRRGYRLESAKAPIRETLAAAMLLSVGWDGSVPLVDPFAGSGTIPIEAALIARRIAPGLGRTFSAEGWPSVLPGTFEAERTAAKSEIQADSAVQVCASDRDAGAVSAIHANAERAGVLAELDVQQTAFSRIQFPDQAGWIVTNPPYGMRVGELTKLRNLYAGIGNLLRERGHGWRLALLLSHPELERQIGTLLSTRWKALNGGIPVRLATSAPF